MLDTLSAARSRAADMPRSRRVHGAELAGLVVLVVVPLLVSDAFAIDRYGRYLLYAVFALSVDLIWGFGGVLTFGHAAFFGAGGYLAAIFMERSGGFLPLSLWPAVALAVVVVAAFAAVLAALAFRGPFPMRGVELAVITLAVAYLLEQYARAGGELTGGQNGILIGPRLTVFGVTVHRGKNFYWFAAAVLVVVYVGVRWFVSSRPGRVVKGIRDNEDRVTMLGYHVPNAKIVVFVVSAAVAAFGGALLYVHEGIVSPAAVGVGASTQVLLWVALGGRGTLIGPIVGTVVLQHLTATLSGTMLDTWILVVGAVLILVVMAFPAGVLGWLDRGPTR